MAQNKTNNILIVGGSSGVGLAVANLSLSQLPGASVVISSSNEDKLKKAVSDIKQQATGGKSLVDYVVGDISRLDSQFDDVEAILQKATERFGSKIDHIVWTAAAPPTYSRPQEGPPSHSSSIGPATTRMFGPLTLLHLAKKYMADTRYSSITITGGSLLYRPMKGVASVIAVNGGMEAATRGLAVDLAPIRTNFVVLGPILTPLLEMMTGGSEMMEKFKEQTLVKAIADAEEAAEPYLYSMRCAFVTGSRIDCDGGMLLA